MTLGAGEAFAPMGRAEGSLIARAGGRAPLAPKGEGWLDYFQNQSAQEAGPAAAVSSRGAESRVAE
jgi:hypothetical protein